ncbi:uncharacterized protein A4U43_C02F13030 [Asparagus officinalis]|uniref:Uncharacterized protein n=1 Tax=Asparagus officinalis TaxID=4686 RepID=A0A5P1FKN5_ASPOF|nr:uncharacterized protein A4U43_C02F13030 [Asparagus officinalis]
MMEMGEGLCKMRKMEFEKDGPLFRFEREVSEVLEFVYQTQKELAAYIFTYKRANGVSLEVERRESFDQIWQSLSHATLSH